MIIYQIINKINGMRYIGQTVRTIEKRWYFHCYKISNCPYISLAIQKYGKDNFSIEVIDKATDLRELNEKEEFWIKFLDTLAPNGYNLNGGGDGKIVSEETRKKLSALLKGRQYSELTLKKMSESHKGKSNNFKGKKHSEEAKKKMSEARKGKKRSPHSEETKKKISESEKETKKKLSEAKKLKRIQKIEEEWLNGNLFEPKRICGDIAIGG